MNDTAGMARDQADRVPAARQVVDAGLADQLLGKVQAEGVELLGPDGLLSQVTKAVLERALAEGRTGYARPRAGWPELGAGCGRQRRDPIRPNAPAAKARCRSGCCCA
jgi:hypothetical protein